MTLNLTTVPETKRAAYALLTAGVSVPRYVLGRNKYAESVARCIDLDGFIDDYTDDTTYRGKPVVRLAELPANCVVVSCVVDARPVTAWDKLLASGVRWPLDYFTLCRLAPRLFRAVDYSQHNETDLESNRSKYDWLHTRLADQESRKTLEKVLQFRATGDLEWMRGFSVDLERQYFDDFMHFAAGEVFVDGGGYDGQTTRRFVSQCPDYSAVHYFEPNSLMMAVSRQNLANLKSIRFVSKGLAGYHGSVQFDASDGSASRISASGGTEITVTRLDDEVKERITFFKMDVEGAEYDAVEGALEHIRADHPKMAICVYHDQRDFWQIPERILAVNPAYDLLLRHYTEGILETVLYFLPSRR